MVAAVASTAEVIENPNDLLDQTEASKLIGVTPETLQVWRCLRRYDLPYLKVGRAVRYRRRDIMAWLESRVVRN